MSSPLFSLTEATSLPTTGRLYFVLDPGATGDDRYFTVATLNEHVQDLMNATLVGGSNISVTYDDPSNTITIAYTGAAPPADTDDLPEGVTNLYFTDERAQDAVGAMVDSTLVYVDGTPLLTRAALTGDVTASQGSNATTIAANAVTFAKMQSITASRLLGRGSAGAGVPQELTVTGGLEFTGAGGIQRSALTGDVTASAGSNATTIASAAVTYSKIQNVTASRLLGRGSAAGSGSPVELTVGGGVEFTGSNGIQRSALTGDVTATAGLNATTIAARAVTAAKLFAATATDKMLARTSASGGDWEEVDFTDLAQAIAASTVTSTALAALGTRREAFNIADDAVATFNTFAYNGTSTVLGSMVMFIPSSTSSGPILFAFCRAATTPAFTVNTGFTMDPSSLLGTTGTSVLTGTTGTDGKINFAAISDGRLQIENRRGFAVSYAIFPFIVTHVG